MSGASSFFDLWDAKPEAAPRRARTVASDSPVPVLPAGGATPYAAAALRSECEDLARVQEGTRNAELNKSAYRLGQLVGAGYISAIPVKVALAEAARATGLPDREIETVLRDDPTGAINRGAAEPRYVETTWTAVEAPPVTVLEVQGSTSVPDLTEDEEDTFWNSRPLLAHLRTFARARTVSPWAVLGVTLARVIVKVPTQVCLPPIIGTKASLNTFVGLVGRSGDGKGIAEGVSADAFKVGYVVKHNVGSGEGIAHGFMHREKGELVWNDDEHAVLFSVPEIDSMAAQGDRKGATLMPQLRSGWSGEELGFGYADPMKRILVPAHEYRMCMVAGIQPERAAYLLDGSDAGTPQRFLWFPATDPGLPDVPPDEPAPMTWTAPKLSGLVGIGGAHIKVCEEARELILSSRRARSRGQGNGLDGHGLLARLKVAAALGITDGRYEVNDEDWRLAGIIQAKSDATRAGVLAVLAQAKQRDNHGRATSEAKRAVLVDEELGEAAIKRTCKTVQRKLEREGAVARTDLSRSIGGRDRQYLADALERLLEAGQIEVVSTAKDALGRGGNGNKYRLSEK